MLNVCGVGTTFRCCQSNGLKRWALSCPNLFTKANVSTMQNSQVPKIGSHMPSLEHMQHMEMLAESWHTRSRILQTIAAKELTYQKQNALAKISQVVRILHILLGDLLPANSVFFSTWPCSLPSQGLASTKPFCKALGGATFLRAPSQEKDQSNTCKYCHKHLELRGCREQSACKDAEHSMHSQERLLDSVWLLGLKAASAIIFNHHGNFVSCSAESFLQGIRFSLQSPFARPTSFKQGPFSRP